MMGPMVYAELSPDWATGSQIGVALTTLVLAFFTWRATRAATKAAEAAEDQVEAQTRPLLIAADARVVAPRAIGGASTRILAEEIVFPDGHRVPVSRVHGTVVGHATSRGWYLSVPLRSVGVGLADIRGIELLEGQGGFAGTTPRPHVPPGEARTRVAG